MLDSVSLGDDELSEDPWDAVLRDGPVDAAEEDESALDPFPPKTNCGRGPAAASRAGGAEADGGTQVGALAAAASRPPPTDM